MPGKSRLVITFVSVFVTGTALSMGSASAVGDDYNILSQTGRPFVSANQNLFPAGIDDAVVVLSKNGQGINKLPFPIEVYGGTYNRIVVSSNGNVQFTGGSGSAAYFNDCLPSGSFNYPIIAPFWDDIVIAPHTTTNKEGLFVKTIGTKPHRQFVINWRGHHFGSLTPIRAGVIFTEKSSVFSFQYLDNDAAEASIGVQRAASGPATQWSCNMGAAVFPGLRLTFVPQ